ncbi:hypothetical protein WI61_08090 [Burkholderia cepacia]|nr:hypothetical protein WI61_08090 [Burkholderia cepacia]KVC00803.1 hypothetical protein WI66_07510 [Burkholderia cepacia]
MADACLLEMSLVPRRRLFPHALLLVQVDHFVGIEPRAVRRQVEHLISSPCRGQPHLSRIGVMHLQVVKNHEHLFAAHVFGQPLQEIKQNIGAHRSLEDLQRTWPRFVMLDITNRLSRRLATRRSEDLAIDA